MKKIYIILASFFLITGCQDNATNIDVKGASAALDAKYSDMIDITASELESVYNQDLSIYEEYVIKTSSKTNGDFYAIIKVDSNKLKDAEANMEELFDILEKQSSLYSPEALNKLQNKTKTKVGDYLIYISSDNNSNYYETVKEYIK